MIRPIVRDPFFLALRSEAACVEDLPVAKDLSDTLLEHWDSCAGMAANMIGVRKRMIAFNHDGQCVVMLNPEIVHCDGPYEAREGCLSLDGVRSATRYQRIKVRFQNTQLQTRLKTFTGWTAQIIQHEIDHCNGILI